MLGDEGTDQQRIHGQARRASHQRRNHDGQQTVAPAADGARGHDAGDGAGKAGQQRNERAPRQAHSAHDAIQQKSRTRQIARIFQHQNEEEQNQNLRQKHQHSTGAGNHAIRQQAVEHAFWQCCLDPFAQRSHPAFDAFHQRLSPAEHGLKHQEQRSQQQQRAPHRVQHDGVNAVITRCIYRRLLHSALHDGGNLRMQRQQLLTRAFAGLRHPLAIQHRRLQIARFVTVQPLQQAAGTILAHAHAFHHGHAQCLAQHSLVHHNAPALGHVAHIEHQHHGQAQRPRLQHQAQVQAQVGGIGHTDQQLGRRLTRMLALDDVTRNALVGAVRIQTVCAWQIQQAHAALGWRGQPAFLALNRDAGVVRYLLARTSQQIE